MEMIHFDHHRFLQKMAKRLPFDIHTATIVSKKLVKSSPAMDTFRLLSDKGAEFESL